ncbi:hypothetical protein C8J57DRAFT_1559049 [Mycena rebaudengoi]|nr:hypothetical protein C8J57DRAFT_1559049 [Mycena rebaudengoi]
MSRDKNPPRWQLDLFNSLYIIGFVLLTLAILPPIFNPLAVRRSKLWISFMFACIIDSLSFLLLVGQQLGPEPPHGLCLFQAGLIHAVPAHATYAGVAFVLDMYFTLRSSLCHSPTPKWISANRVPFLLALPTVVFAGLSILSFAIGLHDPSTVRREPNHMFCHISTGVPTIASAVLSGTAILLAVGFETHAVIMLYRDWHATPNEKTGARQTHAHMGSLIRIALFTLFTLLGLAISLSAMFYSHTNSGVEWNIMLPILPTIVAVLFGAQKDILLGWRFWKRDSKAPQLEAV